MKNIRNSFLWKILRKIKYISKIIHLIIYSLIVGRKNNSSPHIFFCGYSESSNLGDMAQIAITFKILENEFPQYRIIPCRISFLLHKNEIFIKAIKRILTPKDVFIMESGYNSNDGPQNIMHRKIVSTFPDNRILFLQQTIHFNNEDNLKETEKIFNNNNNNNIYFICRDKVSYEFAKKHFYNCKLFLFPDLVTFAIGNVSMKPLKKQEGILVIKRNDAESFYTKNDLMEKLKRNIPYTYKKIVDTVISTPREMVMHNRNKYIRDMLKMISRYKVVITDRYHGLIFCLIANVPVVVLKTNNHKVTTAYEWLSEDYGKSMFFANDIDEAIDIATEIYNKHQKIENEQNFYNRYYNEFLRVLNKCFYITD